MSVGSQELIALNKIPAVSSVPRIPVSSKAQQRAYIIVLVCSDALVLVLAFAAAFWVRFDLGLTFAPNVIPAQEFYPRLVLMLLPLWLGIFALFGLYNFETLMGGTREFSKAFHACTSGMMLVVFVTFLEPEFIVARVWLLSSWVLSVLFIFTSRFLLRRLAYRLRSRGFFVSRAAIVGVNPEAFTLAQELRDSRYSGLEVVGFIAVHGSDPVDRSIGIPVLGSLENLESIQEAHHLSELIVAITAISRTELFHLCERVNGSEEIQLRLSSGLFELLTTRVEVRSLGPVPLVNLKKLRLDPLEAFFKNLVEYGLLLCFLIPLLPLLAGIAILIRATSKGPAIHRRRVLGVGGREFDAFKFRTMYVNGDELMSSQPELLDQLRRDGKLKDDPRVTSVGRWLRKYSLDELPQLINVLKGDMSLVGPRMISPEEARKYGRHRLNLLTVKPGITGLWQVSGRSDLGYEERVRLDIHYIHNYSIWRDLQILIVETLPAVVRGRGAY